MAPLATIQLDHSYTAIEDISNVQTKDVQSSENCKSKNKLRPREDLVEQMRHLWDRLQAQVKYCRDPIDTTNEPALESDE